MRFGMIIFGTTLVAGAALTGCDNGSFDASFDGSGHVEIHLTDAPLDLSGVDGVIVDIVGVSVYPGVEEMDGRETSPIQLMPTPGTFDLLTLTGGATTLLAEGDLPAGHYQRIRLDISAATLRFNDDRTEDLKIESGKVDIPIRFEVRRDDQLSLTLDFDAAASVQVNETSSDEFILRPVVTPVNF